MAGTRSNKKRARSPSPVPEPPARLAKQSKQDGQKAISKDIRVPIDEGFRQGGNFTVLIAEDGTIYDVSLNQTNIGKNNNKFYRLQILHSSSDQHYVHTRWGRVGDFGQMKTLGPFPQLEALKNFDQKFKDKTGHKWEARSEEPKRGKYTFIERSYVSDDEEGDADVKEEHKEEEVEKKAEKNVAPPSQLPAQVQSLMQLIFNQSHFDSVLENIGYNSDKLPLGKLSKSTLKKGFEHLQELASLIKDPSLAETKHSTSYHEAIEDFSNRYYSCIPHIFGRQRAPRIGNDDILQREVQMLDTLSDMEIANKIMKATTEKAEDGQAVNMLDKRFKELNMEEVTPLESDSKEFRSLQEYLISTSGHTHNIQYEVQDIFRISRVGENERFIKSEYAKRKANSCRRLLWHGSRTTNYGGILSQGLRIAPPEAPVNGYAFGKGVYLADISTKSANYCMPGQSGGHGLLLLCEAELGQPMYEIMTSDPDAGTAAKKAGCIATKGLGRTVPMGWVDAGCIHESLNGVLMPDTSKEPGDDSEHPESYLQYNEYICYDVAQLRLRYLLRVQM